jgi:small subunit ribosomal protein S1
MTAQLGVGKDHNSPVVSDQDELLQEGESLTGPEDLDENWWAAVLADEPLGVEEEDQDTPLVAEGSFLNKPEQDLPLVNWDRVNHLFKNDEIIQLNVVSFNRGGLLVEGYDVHGFVPASHLVDLPMNINEEDREQYFNSYLDREIPLKVIECDPEKERIVFSERAALAGAGKRKDLLNSLAEGDVVRGVVTNITNFGVFVDLGGLEGLIHVSELSWGRVQHPSLILKMGAEIETMVVEVMEDRGRVALSLKRLEKNPWDNLSRQISPGDVLDAVITSIVKYGAFARLDEGVEGLIHISTIEFPANCSRIDDLLFEGQTVKVGVINIDAQKRRLGLRLESTD